MGRKKKARPKGFAAIPREKLAEWGRKGIEEARRRGTIHRIQPDEIRKGIEAHKVASRLRREGKLPPLPPRRKLSEEEETLRRSRITGSLRTRMLLTSIIELGVRRSEQQNELAALLGEMFG